MPQDIKTITLTLPFRIGSVNCYLVRTDAGYILIDTGGSNKREELDRELERAGCKPGSLKLIALTHGDFDHSGNAAYFRQKYGAQIAMHREDLGMVERGDMFGNRQKGNNIVMKKLVAILSGFGKAERFTPDLYLDEGDELSAHGFSASVISIPGHSKGSIGILTDSGDLFCGDLLENNDRPGLSSIMDDSATANNSLAKLKSLEIHTVYPGHGNPFSYENLDIS